jgi:hypothetical protein
VNVIDRQVYDKLPTLVLRLKSPSSLTHRHFINQYRSPHESDDYAFELFKMKIEEFREELIANLDNFQQIVFNARPVQLPDMNMVEYQHRMNIYQKVLVMSTAIIDRLKDSFKDIMQEYRTYLDSVWSAIENGENVSKLQSKFERRVEQKIDRSWTPVFEEVDRLILEIESNKNSIVAYTPPNKLHYRQHHYYTFDRF